ncbi:MAG: hypothetical protein AAGJ93_03780 [Bacteroidota bacterium]
MKNSTLIRLLRTLDKKECREFTKWLASPFFNQRQDVVTLFRYLTDGNHLFEEKFLTKERIHKKIFPKVDFDDAKFRQTVHFLHKQLEHYLAYKEIEEEQYALPVAYLKSLRKRKADQIFQKKFNTLRKNGLSDDKTLDGDGLRHSFEMLSEHYTLMLETNQSKNEYLQETSATFDLYLIAEKLKQTCLENSHNKVYKTNYEGYLTKEVLRLIESEPQLLQHPAIAVYYYGYRIQQRGDNRDQYYFELRKLIKNYQHIFSTNEQKHIYRMAINYCIERMNKGAATFVREAFEMYKKGLEDNFLIQDNVLGGITYLNIGTAALRLKEYEWADKYVNKYARFVEEKYRENFKDYLLAKLAFEQKRYDQAMILLFGFESKHILVNLNARAMLIKIYYEQDEIDALESLLESTNAYLKRKANNTGYQANTTANMVKYTRKLVRVNPFDKQKRAALREEIANANPLTERAWLLKQVDKLD